MSLQGMLSAGKGRKCAPVRSRNLPFEAFRCGHQAGEAKEVIEAGGRVVTHRTDRRYVSPGNVESG